MNRHVQGIETRINNAVRKRISQLARYQVLVGIPKDAPNYPDGTSLAEVAYTNEFGSDDGRVPERSFLRKGIYGRAAKYHALLRTVLEKLLRNPEARAKAEMQKVGLIASQDVKQQIDDTYTPPNAEYTIRLKGSSHPLIDTGHLRQQITYKVRKRSEG